jgi:hypothetical protein
MEWEQYLTDVRSNFSWAISWIYPVQRISYLPFIFFWGNYIFSITLRRIKWWYWPDSIIYWNVKIIWEFEDFF